MTRQPDTISKDTEFKEISTTIRHYSNLRFLIMPIFFAINGGLFIGFQNDKLRSLPNIWFLLLVLPAWVCVVFSVLEINLNRYIERFVAHGELLKPGGLWSKRPSPPRRFTVTRWVVTLYLIVAACWWVVAVSLWIQSRQPVVCL
jgi:hypothetical protein